MDDAGSRYEPFRLPDASESENVEQELLRDRMLVRIRKARALAEQNIREIDAWNAAHPDEQPIPHETEDMMIAFTEGRATLAELERAFIHDAGLKTFGEEQANG